MAFGLSATAIAAIVGAAATTAGTAYAISQGSQSLPRVTPPSPPPPVPPAPAAAPPPPTQTEEDKAPAKAKRARQQQYGVADTLLVSPLGAGGAGSTATGRTLLGG